MSLLVPAASSSRDRRLAELAGRQHGAVTTSQLRSLGFDAAVISRWAIRGRLHRVHRGVYLVGHAHAAERSTWACAVLAGGGDAALSDVSAARLHGIWRRGSGVTTHVTGTRQHRPTAGVRFHRCMVFDPSDVEVVDGIRVTTVARTIVDLAQTLTAGQLAHVMHEAAYLRVLDVEQVRAVAERLRGRRGIHRVLAALVLHESGSAGTRSGLEDRFLACVVAWHLPSPRLNERIEVMGRSFELDFWWPSARVCVEVDGPGHARARARRADRERDQCLAAAGIQVIRVGPGELKRRGELRRTVTAALTVPPC